MRRVCAILLAAVFLMTAPAALRAHGPPSTDDGPANRASENIRVDKGLRVEFSVNPMALGTFQPEQVQEGQYAQVKFRVTDAATGAPVTPLQPASWISIIKGEQYRQEEPAMECKEWISALLQGSLTYRAEIDLNKFFILIMNDDSTISVVDPIMGVTGITQLYAMVNLEKPGEDWVESPDGTRLVVSMPEAGKVALVDTETFKVTKNVEVGTNPVRIAYQPDAKYLWVGNDSSDPEKSGVTVIDARTLAIAAHIPTGPGHHEIAFSDDSLTAYVTNGQGTTLSVIDTQKLQKIKDLEVGKGPVAVAFSPLSKQAYVTSYDGTISVVSSETHEVAKKIETEPGLATFRFAPGDRWGFIANKEQSRVLILDVSNDAIAHALSAGKQPDQFAFTEGQAYIRSLGTPDVHMINLGQLNQGKPPILTTATMGQRAPQEYQRPSVADAISPTGEWNTVVALNPKDRFVFYYMEGMVAPMGSYQTYGRIPRAVRVVDRSLRETEKGVYAGKFLIPAAGEYRVGFLLDAPVAHHCFQFTAAPHPSKMGDMRKKGPIKVELLSEKTMQPGKAFKFRFSLAEAGSGTLISGEKDVTVIVTRPPGWRTKKIAKPLEDGTYEVELTPDKAGFYTAFFHIPSRRMEVAHMPFLALRAQRENASAKSD